MTKDIDDLILSVRDEVIAWRRHLHQYPELSFQENKTSQFVYDTLLSSGNLDVSRPTATSVVARLTGRLPGKVLALRADMDALAIQEETGFAFASQNPGVMHACGHDGHTAMLLGAAKVLSQCQDRLAGEVRFIFQHAEELFPGGAQQMVDAGVLDGVDRILGIHVMSNYPLGKIALCYGPTTAASDCFDLVIQGKGGHASQPDMTIDPVVIGGQIVANLQQLVSRYVSPMDKFVVSVTKFQGGSAYNVIPDSVLLAGSVRSLNSAIRQKAPQWIERIAKGLTEAHGASYTFSYHYGYKSVINNPALTKQMEDLITRIFGKEAVLLTDPVLGGEDFSAFSDIVPGCYMMLGTGSPEKGAVYPHHHPKYTLDESALAMGTSLYTHAALRNSESR